MVRGLVNWGWGGGGVCGQGASNPIAKNCRKIAGKLQCCKQTFRSLKEQYFGTGDTQDINKHARWTSKKQSREIAENYGKLHKIIKLQKMAENCGLQTPNHPNRGRSPRDWMHPHNHSLKDAKRV